MLTLAYFDPGSASLLMQALVGGSAGLIVFGRYLWMSLTGSGMPEVVSTSSAATRPLPPTERLRDESLMAEALSGEFRFHAS